MHISTEPSIDARLSGVHETTAKRGTHLRQPRLECKILVEKLLSHADIAIGGDRPWDISVRDDRFYGRVLLHGSLGLGESYVDGWWDSRSLDQFLSRVLCASLDSNPLWNWRMGLRRLLSDEFNQQTRPQAQRGATTRRNRPPALAGRPLPSQPGHHPRLRPPSARRPRA